MCNYGKMIMLALDFNIIMKLHIVNFKGERIHEMLSHSVFQSLFQSQQRLETEKAKK